MLKHTFYFTTFMLILLIFFGAKLTPIVAQELDACSEIIFWSERESGVGYYIMNSEGSNVRLFPHGDMMEHNRLTWSPDGSQVAFAERYEEDKIQHLFMMNADGTNLRELAASNPAGYLGKNFGWSPDGQKFIYVDDEDKISRLIVLLDGTRSVLFETENLISDVKWSPDSLKAAFQVGYQIWLYDFRTEKSTQYTFDTAYIHTMLDWTSDSRQLAVRILWPSYWVYIGVIDAEVGNFRYVTPLTEYPDWGDQFIMWLPSNNTLLVATDRFEPDGLYTIAARMDLLGIEEHYVGDDYNVMSGFLSDDGRNLAFLGFRPTANPNINITALYLMDRDTLKVRKLLNIYYELFTGLDWSPDGTRIVYSVYSDGSDDLFSIDVDGRNLIRLTDHPASDSSPIWRPCVETG